MGTPEFAATPLEHLLLNSYEVVAVYTRPDRPAGRGRHLVSPPVKTLAEGWRLPVLQPPTLAKAVVVDKLAEYRPDVIVVAAFGQILPPSVLNLPRHGCINPGRRRVYRCQHHAAGPGLGHWASVGQGPDSHRRWGY
jgi:methionyl-tRNA formyltransferase